MKKLTIAIICLLSISVTTAQDLDALMDSEMEDTPSEVVKGVFLGTRIINLPSTTFTNRGMLDFRISHRFGAFKEGASQLFGIDNAQIRFNLEYGFTDGLLVGVARSSFRKTYEGYFKYKLLEQTEGEKAFPFTLGVYANIGVWSESDFDFVDGIRAETYEFTDRLTYTYQLLLSRKFSKAFSAQLNPTLVQFGYQNLGSDQLAYALGMGGRLKLSPRFALTSEYVYLFNKADLPLVNGQRPANSFSVGVNIETGGHNFQLHITNSVPQNASGYIAQTTERWEDGEIRFGFNIKRSFTVKK